MSTVARMRTAANLIWKCKMVSKVNHILQKRSHTCGHTCVAMLSGKDEEDIIDLIGHDRGTKTKEIVAALDALKISNSKKLIRLSKNKPISDVAIIKVVPVKRFNANWHWVLKFGDKIYDPDPGLSNADERYVSYIKISGTNKKHMDN